MTSDLSSTLEVFIDNDALYKSVYTLFYLLDSAILTNSQE